MWNWALMDYGAHLKQKGIRVNAQSTQYAKQSVFEGSLRQARGAVLRELAKGKRSQKTLEQLFGAKRRAQVRAALTALSEEALIQKRGRNFALAH
jgi:A/G-specific adenine glycosylase